MRDGKRVRERGDRVRDGGEEMVKEEREKAEREEREQMGRRDERGVVE